MKLLLWLLLLFPTLAFAAPPDVSGLVSILIYLIVIGLIFYVIWWFIGYVGVPEPFNKVIRVIVGLVALLIVIYFLLSLTGGGGGLRLGG